MSNYEVDSRLRGNDKVAYCHSCEGRSPGVKEVDFQDFGHPASDWLSTSNEQPGDLALLAEDWLKQTIWYEP